jgi:hypothetical protein
MGLYGLDWIEQLPAELAGQRVLLRCLLALCAADDNIRWLVIGCSLARGAGDRLSDLDVAMGIRDDEFDATIPVVRRAVDGLGDLVESYHPPPCTSPTRSTGSPASWTSLPSKSRTPSNLRSLTWTLRGCCPLPSNWQDC